MRDLAREVLDLQRQWSDKNTPAMQRRGMIIRTEIPNWLRAVATELSHGLGPAGSDLSFEGRDGTGRKTEIPWVRFCSASRSPNAREGWYCVFLFHALGNGFYISLGHGSTRYEGGEFRPRSPQELTELVVWARGILGERLVNPRIVTSIELGARKSDLGTAYANGTVAAFWYPQDEIPTETALASDALVLADMLGKLYQAQDLGRTPESQPIDIAAATEALTRIAQPLARRTGQGFGLTQAERRAVELRAMEVAKLHLEATGFQVEDVSACESFDFRAKDSTSDLIVEVKGSTGSCDSILLTGPEVVLHRKHFPNNVLILVHGIDLRRRAKSPRASGGILRVIRPWFVNPDALEPTAFRYKISDGDT